MINQSAREISIEILRLNAQGVLLSVINRYGGERIVAGPTMDKMREELLEAIIDPHDFSFFQELSERRQAHD